MAKIYIDGSAGTTGLRIYERLAQRKDLELIILSDEKRKIPEYKKEAMLKSDITFLCLPDDAARESVELAKDADTVIIDTSTAHRTSADFTYGFPEIIGYDKIAAAKKIANPGCHASGFVALIYPLVKAGLLSKDAKLSCFSITGYSGGGKKMIADYEGEDRDPLLNAPRQYGISQTHKHLKEMGYICGLDAAPLFSPIVADFYSGMEVTVPLCADMVNGTMEDIRNAYMSFYSNDKGLVHFKDSVDENGFLSAAAYAGRDDMEISVNGNPDRMILTSRFDNLGKGASGSAIQNMNIVLGVDENSGLVI